LAGGISFYILYIFPTLLAPNHRSSKTLRCSGWAFSLVYWFIGEHRTPHKPINKSERLLALVAQLRRRAKSHKNGLSRELALLAQLFFLNFFIKKKKINVIVYIIDIQKKKGEPRASRSVSDFVIRGSAIQIGIIFSKPYKE
jgi:hypothetical protein